MDLLSPLVVAGMHRSGTSLTASLLQTLGTHLGQTLVAADRHNPKGYFEDLDFVTLQRQMLTAACPVDDGGWPDWGWTEHEQFDRDRLWDTGRPPKPRFAAKTGLRGKTVG
ncbi:MAG: hypothetical protein HC918_12650, partial [Oscillatoriales cyanobacterium SM2_1_8]|nr:hypothetical protein [Oscillatoriales cyanobacterium SM2_1_8]